MRKSVEVGIRPISTPGASSSETKGDDAVILIFCGLGLVGLTAAGYASAVHFGIERQIIELLTAVMP
jgi:hypothetical protein